MINSHTHLNREKNHSDVRSAESWSDDISDYVAILEDSLDEAEVPKDGKSLDVLTVSVRSLSTRATIMGRLAQAEDSSSVPKHLRFSSRGIGRNGLSTEAVTLLDDVRRAMERDPESALASALRLVKVLTLPTVGKSVDFRGGLAPWQMRKVDRYMKEHIESPLRLKTLADQVGLSISHFCRAFKESFGTTTHTHIIRLRVELAQRLMLTTDEQLCQIALACGLADQACLSKLFRSRVGETPNAWRRQNLTDDQVEARNRRSKRRHFSGLTNYQQSTSEMLDIGLGGANMK